jgi:hypothetical protein
VKGVLKSLATRFPGLLPWDQVLNKFNMQWIRWFASIPNLILLGLVFFGLWFVIGFVRLIGFLAHTPSPALPVVKARAQAPVRKVANPWQ